MKRNYWVIKDMKWYWEKTGEIFVFGLSNISDYEIDYTIDVIIKVVQEFNLPLSIKSGNNHKKEDFKIIVDLVKECSYKKGVIDFDLLEEKLFNLRNTQGILPYGIILLVDDLEYEFKTPEAVYGCGSTEGLIVIRKKHIKKPVVMHEFGHMIGLNHHNNCVMNYYCSYDQFCTNCKEEIKKLWET